jgi:hypothetical protein
MRSQMLVSLRNIFHPGEQKDVVFIQALAVVPKVPSVTAGLGYLSPTTERPYNYMYEPPVGMARQNCEYLMTSVQIADARVKASRPSIQLEGFELWDAPTSMMDFHDEDAIRDCYYAEAAELAKCVTSAEHAYIFDHLVRRREPGRCAEFRTQSGR